MSDEKTCYLDGDATVGALVLRARLLDACARVTHGFATRRGGVSQSPVDSLDFGRQSTTAQRAENRRRLAIRLGGSASAVYHATQVHRARVLSVDGRRPPEQLGDEQADALVTTTPGLLIGVLTADCVPVLIADARGRAVAAVHGGWRGLALGVLEASVTALIDRGCEVCDLVAVVGPCVGVGGYEVGPEVAAAFGDLPAVVRGPLGAGGRPHVDLAAAAAQLLGAAGISRVEVAGLCTRERADLFYSYRRDGDQAGRQLSLIGIIGS